MTQSLKGMKRVIIWTAAALMMSALRSNAGEPTSPDGLFSVQSSRSAVSLVDSKGLPVVTLRRSTTPGTTIDVSWARTSKRLIVITNNPLGSAIVGAWTEDNGATWRLAQEPDADLVTMANQAQRSAESRLIAESFTLGDWVSPDELQVKGSMKFGNHRQAEFSYVLAFASGSLVAKDYKFTLSAN
jgi:hypothetical protein